MGTLSATLCFLDIQATDPCADLGLTVVQISDYYLKKMKYSIFENQQSPVSLLWKWPKLRIYVVRIRKAQRVNSIVTDMLYIGQWGWLFISQIVSKPHQYKPFLAIQLFSRVIY